MISFPGRGLLLRAGRRLAIEADRLAAPFRRADLALFHEFAPPPAGGGHQFLRALLREWSAAGWIVENNRISAGTRAVLLNSFNFDPARLRRLRRAGLRIVHRVDGPIGVYRGLDDGTDARILALAREFADATIFQSDYSLEQHRALGLDFPAPTVIPNAADPELFHPRGRRAAPDGRRKVRLISVAWSDNPNKGADDYRWLDEHLDWTRYEYRFVGRIRERFRHIEHVQPVDSAALADLLRDSDVYLTASRHDPCSNSLIEALACGLPAVFLHSGGHPELTQGGGLGYERAEEIPERLAELVAGYERFRAAIPAHELRLAAGRYLSALGLAEP